MKIDYGGQAYELDLTAITNKQAMVIQSFIGMSIKQLFDQFEEIEEDTPELLRAITCVYWLMKNQAGEKFPIAEAEFPLVPFLEAFFTALVGEAKAAAPAQPQEPEGEPGPTLPPPAASASPTAPLTLSSTPEVVLADITVS